MGGEAHALPSYRRVMMKIFDKQIHKDDFRLRLLVTDGCNKNCHHCLNDFQTRPTDRIKFLDPTVAKEIIKEYLVLDSDSVVFFRCIQFLCFED